MGIFGGDAQAQVDLDDLKARVAKLEAAVASLQAQAGAGGAVRRGAGRRLRRDRRGHRRSATRPGWPRSGS